MLPLHLIQKPNLATHYFDFLRDGDAPPFNNNLSLKSKILFIA